MEPAKGFFASLWTFLYFLPFFIGLLVLGIVKGALLCPLICLIMTIGNSTVILGLWPAHAIWTNYCILRAKRLGPILKIVLCIGISLILVLWPPVGILSSILAGVGYGFLAPIIATFEAVGEGKTNMFFHCFWDGTWDTVKGSIIVVGDLKDVAFHSYFSLMDDLRRQDPPNGVPHELRLFDVLAAVIVGVIGIIIDLPMITLIALFKSPYMLFKGWKRLFEDLIGREGPFLETACVPFAGLAIILWPAAVVGAVAASSISSLFIGGYAAVVMYEESSIQKGLAYVVASLSIFDEYSNDVLDMPAGSYFPRPRYRKQESLYSGTLSRPTSFNKEKQDAKKPLAKTMSLKNKVLEFKPIKLLELLLIECKRHGEALIADGIITAKDIEESKSNKDGSRIIAIGLPAYCILQALLRSVKANSDGLLLSDKTELTLDNKPKDTFFDWFLEPLLILKDQIKSVDLLEEEENYLCKLVLLVGDPKRVGDIDVGMILQNKRRQAEISAFARRLQGITKSISRYPTYKRRFDGLVKTLSEELEKKIGGSLSSNGSRSTQRSISGLGRLFSQKSFGRKTSNKGVNDQEVHP
ncbi:putative membrane protein [Dioscorea sansibarensis]